MRTPHDTTRSRISTAAVVVAALALFVALGGPAYAARLIDGATIKAGSVTSRQLADKAVSLAKIDRKARTALKAKGATGPQGPAGSPGPQGDTGAPGRAGGLDVYDALGRRAGTFGGLLGTLVIVTNDQGASFLYDPSPTGSYPLPVQPAALYFKGGGCDGQAYMTAGAYPTNFAVLLQSPPGAGDTAYVGAPGAVEVFTAQSSLTSSGCTDSSSGVTNMLPANPAGEAPAIKKPLELRPRP